MTPVPKPKVKPKVRKPLKRTTRVKPVNAKRKTAEFARCYHSKERVEFVRSLPCIVCFAYPSENAHIRGDGMRRKASYRLIVPLCHKHHTGGKDSLHTLGVMLFEAEHQVNLYYRAGLTEGLWLNPLVP